jgi:SAM-dependent methyltransferase
VTLPLDVMRCPVCRGRLEDEPERLRCTSCGAVFPIEDSIPRMLDDRIPGIAEKRAEIEGWPAMARAEGWYEPDDEVDAHLPYLTRDLAWEDRTWRANEHSFSLLLERYVRPGMRVLEVGAAKAWAAQHLVPLGADYVATDILADPLIGLGRGAFYEARVGPFARIQADGEHLPFASGSFDLVYCVAALHHALDLRRMVAEMARVTRRGGTVAACAWDHGGGQSPLAPFWRAVRDVRPDAGDESVQAGTSEGHLAELLRSAGCGDVDDAALSVRVEHPTFDEWWQPFTLGVGPAGVLLARLDADVAAQVRESARDIVGDGPVAIPARAWAARGRA